MGFFRVVSRVRKLWEGMRKRKEIRKYGIGNADFMVGVSSGLGCGQVGNSPALFFTDRWGKGGDKSRRTIIIPTS